MFGDLYDDDSAEREADRTFHTDFDLLALKNPLYPERLWKKRISRRAVEEAVAEEKLKAGE